MKALKFLLIVVALIASFFPLTVFSVYLFTFDKQALVDFLIKIPKNKFWLFMIPAVIMCYGCTCWLFLKMMDISHPKPLPQKEVFYLEDDHLGEKLQGLISVRPGTYDEDVMSTIELDENVSSIP